MITYSTLYNREHRFYTLPKLVGTRRRRRRRRRRKVGRGSRSRRLERGREIDEREEYGSAEFRPALFSHAVRCAAAQRLM